MKCPSCNLSLRKLEVTVAGAAHKVTSYQCEKCDYVEFEPEASHKVVQELHKTPTKIKLNDKVKVLPPKNGEVFGEVFGKIPHLKKSTDQILNEIDKELWGE